MTEHYLHHQNRTPAAVAFYCACGWSTRQTRRQNALARAAKLRAAFTAHLKLVAANEAARQETPA